MRGRNPRFLIVEDSPDDEKLIRRALRRIDRDIDVRAVHDGEQAIDYLCEDGSDHLMPDLVFLDWKLPRVMGREVLQWIRSSSRCKGLVVVAFSSSDSPCDEEECKLLGGNAYVVKPVDYEPFMNAVLAIVKEYGPAALLGGASSPRCAVVSCLDSASAS